MLYISLKAHNQWPLKIHKPVITKLMKTLLKNPNESGDVVVDGVFPAFYRAAESVRGWRPLPLTVVSEVAKLLAFIRIPL